VKYVELLEILRGLSVEELEQTVTIFCPISDEYTAVTSAGTASYDDVLMAGDLFLQTAIEASCNNCGDPTNDPASCLCWISRWGSDK
jgi:hypothetical protein